MVTASGEILSRARVCICPQYGHDRSMIEVSGGGLAETFFGSGIECPQALHLAVFEPGGILAALSV